MTSLVLAYETFICAFLPNGLKIGWKIIVLSAAPQRQTCQPEPFEVGSLHQGINAQLQQS